MQVLHTYTINVHILSELSVGRHFEQLGVNTSLKGILTTQNVPTTLLPTAHFSRFRQQPRLKPDTFLLTPLQNELPPPPLNSW